MSFNAGKSVMNMTETLWENSLIIAEDVLIIHVNVIVIAVTSSEKNAGITFVQPHLILLPVLASEFVTC
jgi:hypothetical protein